MQSRAAVADATRGVRRAAQARAQETLRAGLHDRSRGMRDGVEHGLLATWDRWDLGLATSSPPVDAPPTRPPTRNRTHGRPTSTATLGSSRAGAALPARLTRTLGAGIATLSTFRRTTPAFHGRFSSPPPPETLLHLIAATVGLTAFLAPALPGRVPSAISRARHRGPSRWAPGVSTQSSASGSDKRRFVRRN
jgi:hypothetical protein